LEINSEYVSVKDELPSKVGMYMCKHENGREFSDYYYKTMVGKMVWVSELCEKAVVTHWKPKKNEKK
jgi:hypothetical protein